MTESSCGRDGCDIKTTHYHAGQERPPADYVEIPFSVVRILEQQQTMIQRLGKRIESMHNVQALMNYNARLRAALEKISKHRLRGHKTHAALLAEEALSGKSTSGGVEEDLEEDRRIFGTAYWLETAGGRIRLNPEELRMRMSDGRFRVVADMDTVAQRQAVFDFVVSLRREAYNAQKVSSVEKGDAP